MASIFAALGIACGGAGAALPVTTDNPASWELSDDGSAWIPALASTAPDMLELAPRANNTGLPDQLKSGIESLSGLSMDHVRVHYNSSKPAELNALAYAQGSDIHLAPGQEQHLPHEAWHVVQQRQGRSSTRP